MSTAPELLSPETAAARLGIARATLARPSGGGLEVRPVNDLGAVGHLSDVNDGDRAARDVVEQGG